MFYPEVYVSSGSEEIEMLTLETSRDVVQNIVNGHELVRYGFSLDDRSFVFGTIWHRLLDNSFCILEVPVKERVERAAHTLKSLLRKHPPNAFNC